MTTSKRTSRAANRGAIPVGRVTGNEVRKAVGPLIGAAAAEKVRGAQIHKEKPRSWAAVQTALGLPVHFTDADLARVSFHGAPAVVIKEFDAVFPKDVVSRILGAPRTLRRRVAAQKVLNRDETDRALRIFRVLTLASKVFGNDEKATRWLNRPSKTLDVDQGEASPIDLLQTEHGARVVEQRLHQIDHGVFA